ncbi:MAG: hypothetical protein ACM3SS_21745 [Rhodospirillaceae bacterium]
MQATARDLSTPEATFAEYQQAWVQKDVPRFLATISFQQEAYEKLQARGVPVTDPNDLSVTKFAAEVETELRTLLQTRGFIATDISSCKIAQKILLSENEVRFILSCKSTTSALLMPIRLMRFPAGWLVVRGG